MIKKRIPQKYAYENIDVPAIVENVLGKVPISFNSNGLLIIDANPTPEQLQQIKSDFLAAVEEVTEL